MCGQGGFQHLPEPRVPEHDARTEGGPQRSVPRVADAVLVDAKNRLPLRQAGRVVHLHNALLAAALAEAQPRRGGVRHDVPANRLLRVRLIQRGGAVHVRDDLVRDDDRDAVLLGEVVQGAEELAQVHLARRELVAPAVVRAVERGRAVHDDQREAVLGHHRGGLQQQLLLVVRVEGPCAGHVREHVLRVQLVALRDGDEPLRAERALRVDVERHALRAALRDGHLARHAERVAELRLAGAELPEELRDAARLDAAAEQLIQLAAAGRDDDNLLAHLVVVDRGGEAHWHQLGALAHDLLRLVLADALDGQDGLLGCVRDGLDGVEAALHQLLDVPARHAVVLELLHHAEARRVAVGRHFRRGVHGLLGGLALDHLHLLVRLAASALRLGFGAGLHLGKER
ncbi:DNA repair protein RAD51 [Strigomonas culicis]|uniref:DNA repair protein RAD51 n=1 Tax=Strigomonas culicis TaxID=28005 RepID=S9UL58_9TRYP|nr:DNA repair protein RAD51 [Strigomonas culicis]|eukprot:EPY29658.1 DNA repair protein RAD51 [Strigomonas culicis]